MAEAKSKDGKHLLLLNDAEANTVHFGALLALKQATVGNDIAIPTVKNALAIHEALSPITAKLADDEIKKSEKK